MKLRWIEKQAEREAKRDRMKTSDRIGNLVSVIVSIVITIFFYGNYSGNTGLFTSSFTNADAALFFGAAIFGMAPAAARFLIGRRNPTRLLDALTAAFFLIVVVWFLATYPFDMSHLADLLPNGWHGLLSWVSDNFVKALMVIGIVASVFIIPYTILLYQAVRRKLKAPVAS